jgi:hypothetical protein
MRHWSVTQSEDAIVISCYGHDKEGQFVAAVRQFREFAAARRSRFKVIADLRHMTGYETAARRAWQEGFREQRQLMRAVILVGAPSRGIRMGAAVVAAVAGVPVRFVEDWSEVAGLSLR